MSDYAIELLAGHDRSTFVSDAPSLDRYFQQQVTQDVRRRIAACFVAVATTDAKVAGFYTLSATSLILDQLSPERARKLPRYPVVPAILLGRLAIDVSHQGRGLGGALVVDALSVRREARSSGALWLWMRSMRLQRGSTSIWALSVWPMIPIG